MLTSEKNSRNHTLSASQEAGLRAIDGLDGKLHHKFESKFAVQPMLSRSLVSFQANKTRPLYRWYKYKEAFSASLVEYFLEQYSLSKGRILDPFAGSGTTLFAASSVGLRGDGIELLPLGQEIIQTRRQLTTEFEPADFDHLRRWASLKVWEQAGAKSAIAELRITHGAYPKETEESIQKYVSALQVENPRVRIALRFALLCVLESISYTRKDGQYLRWDYRSGRRQGAKPFDKGKIADFREAVSEKINEIVTDLTIPSAQLALFPSNHHQAPIRLYNGSCLEVMPKLNANTYHSIITSPPYCNRYDYTRTYALELALLGIDEAELVRLRQTMLSCTVENRTKDLLTMNPSWADAIKVADNQELLQAILKYLDDLKAEGVLNNNGIPRMVKGYFYEMACVIAECSRVLHQNAPLIMVNDNVRYAGASISVDAILSDFAEQLGFCIEKILVLPNGKGNSSQQMGAHGRESLRKCVYIWRKL